ncbi:uncharacterized protein LOC143200054 [Rhynchophorus ferrugineus]|uniref:uncharacterized protein LOC143200054 n=1 Tax=Rhynchophorus ferrugineus TaxID=354439 RepID=UPI003FCDE29E
MGDQILSDLDTVLKKLDKNNTTSKMMSLSEYNNELKVLKINLDINGKDKLALQTLKSLIDKNIHSIQKDVISILEGGIDKRLKNSIIDSIAKYLMNLITTKNFTDLVSLYTVWKSYNIEKFKEMLAGLADLSNPSNCTCISSVEFLLDYMLPEITNYKDNNLRQPLVELTTLYTDAFPISDLKPDEFKSFLIKLPGFFRSIEGLQETRIDIWRDIFHILLKYIDHKLSNAEVQEVFKNASSDWNVVRNELGNNLNDECLKYMSDGNVADLTKVYCEWSNLDYQKFVDNLTELCHGAVSKIKCKCFIFDKLIPEMMSVSNTHDRLKISYIDLGLVFASVFPIASLDDTEYHKLLTNVNEYIKNIADLRDKQFECWEKLWMFLVRLLGKKLHHSMSLINRLLRVVEHAFRNSCYEQRLKGYDCWKELIDNVSLDAHHLSSEKQIRLLLTPLRAKFSRQELVICKRFDVFIYLIEKLQAKSFLVLKEFLEFCFGEVSEDTDPNKAGQGKSFPGLWLRSAKVLIGLLGHSHGENENCLDTSSEIVLKSPVVNSSNISTYCTTIINSVIECCILLKDIELNRQREIIMKCLCKTLTTLILNPDIANKEKCMEALAKSLSKLIKDEDSYKNSIAVMIFKSLICVGPENITLLASHNLNNILQILFTIPLATENYVQVEKFRILLSNVEKNERINHDKAILDCFSKFKTCDVNVHLVVPFWLQLAVELDQFLQENILDYLLWPVIYLHQISEENQKVLVYDNYKEVVSTFVERHAELHLALIKGLDKCLRNNPRLLRNILTIIGLFSLKSANKETICGTLDLIIHILNTPFVGDNSLKLEKVESYLKEYYETNVDKLQESDVVKKLCSCVEHLLKSKCYGILDVLTKSVSNLPDSIKASYAKFFSLDLLTDIFEKESQSEASKKGLKFTDLLKNLKHTDSKKDIKMYMPVGGRSAKIADLVKQIPASPVKESKLSTLRLFGKDIGTMSPLNVKGSKMKESNSNTPSKFVSPSATIKKPKKSFPIDDESSSKFVLIDSEVKIKPDTLTEHQKESLKKRPVIPALYQDLSQSQSLDMHPSKNDVESVKAEGDNCAEVREADSKLLNENDREDSLDSNDSSKSTKREKELKKLVMDIVGAEKFVSAPSRRSRREKKLDEDQENQVNTDSLELNNQKVVTIPIEKLDDSISQSSVIKLADVDKITNSPKRKRRKTLPKRKSSLNNDSTNETEVPEDDKVITGSLTRDNSEDDKESTHISVEESSVSDQHPSVSDLNLDKEPVPRGEAKTVQITLNSDTKRKPGRPPKAAEGKIKQVQDVPPPVPPVRKSLRKTIPPKKLIDIDAHNSENETENAPSDVKITDNQNNNEKLKKRRSRSNSKSTTIDEKNIIKKGKKRKRNDESESDDCIESSQDSSLHSSANTSVLRKSLNIKINVNNMTSGYVQSQDDSITEKKSKKKPEKSGETKCESKQNPSHSEELFQSIEESPEHKSIENNKKRKSKSPKNISDKLESKKKISTTPQQIVLKHISEAIEEVVNGSNCSTPVKSLGNDLKGTTQASPQEVVETTQNQDTQTQDGQTEDDTQTQNTESVNCDIIDIHINVDLPKKPVLTDADKAIAMMDTASLALESSEEYKQDHFNNISGIDNIDPKIPVHDEDKTLTNSNVEKLNVINEDNLECTANAETESIIAETKSIVAETESIVAEITVSNVGETDLETLDKSAELDDTNIPSSPVTGETPNRTSELLNNTLDISPIALKQISKDVLSDDDEFIEEAQPRLVPVALKFDNEEGEHEDKIKSPEKADDAPNKNTSDPEKDSKVEVDKQCCDKDDVITVNNPVIERSKFLTSINSPINRRRFLKTMSPSVSRIKKLMSKVKRPSDSDDAMATVSQEDILTFSREVPSPLALPRSSILKRKYSETEESLSPCAKRKRVNFSDPCTTSRKVFIKDDNSDKSLFEMSTEEDIDNQFMKIMNGDMNSISPLVGLEINTIEYDRPIYPNLVDCYVDIIVVAKKLTGPMFIKTLLTKLKNKGIKTIGDLAKMTESEISKLPFKAPAVANVYKVLNKYYMKNYKVAEEELLETFDISEHDKSFDESIETVDAKSSLTTVLENAQAEGLSTKDICDVVFPMLSRDDLIVYAQSHFNMVTKDDGELKANANEPRPGSSKEILDTQPSPPANPLEPLIEQLSSATPDEIVQMYSLIADKLAMVSPNKLIDMAIKTLQKIPL